MPLGSGMEQHGRLCQIMGAQHSAPVISALEYIPVPVNVCDF